MNKDTLEKILLRYSGAATVILGAQAANGQIIWTDIQDTVLNKNGEFYDFNIDADTSGIIDYRIVQFIDSTIYDVTGVQIETSGTAGNQVLGLNHFNYSYPFRLNVGDTIGPGQPFNGLGKSSGGVQVGYMALSIGDTTYPNSQFVNTVSGITDGFLGLRFRGNQNDTIRTFYGWIRVDVAADLKSVTIKDFAYQSTPDSMITAGQGSPIGIEEMDIELPGIVQRGKFLDIELPESFVPDAELKFYDMSGSLVRQEEINKHSSRISLKDFPKGIMVVAVKSNGREATKKVVIY